MEGDASCIPTQEERVLAQSVGTIQKQASPNTWFTYRAVAGVGRLQTVAWGRMTCSLKDDSSPEDGAQWAHVQGWALRLSTVIETCLNEISCNVLSSEICPEATEMPLF